MLGDSQRYRSDKKLKSRIGCPSQATVAFVSTFEEWEGDITLSLTNNDLQLQSCIQRSRWWYIPVVVLSCVTVNCATA